LLGGVLSLVGAGCYAELATTYPRSGGDYVYLTRAYGSWAGFLFGWAQLAVLLTGSIGLMAYIFSDYARQLFDFGPESSFTYAAVAVVLLTWLNLFGLVAGKRTQNVLTASKVLGLGGILAAGFFYRGHSGGPPPPPNAGGVGLAMVLILYTFGGWNDAAFVAADVRQGRRTMALALFVGVAAVTVIYVLLNAAYLHALGFGGVRASGAVAADVLNRALGQAGARVISALIMVSALGSINGMILTGSRLYSALGADHRIFAWLGRRQGARRVPAGALLTQAAITLALMALVGTDLGRSAVDSVLVSLGWRPLTWFGRSGFSSLLDCTAPAFWSFFLLTGVSLFVLRARDRGIARPFTVPFYPVLPMAFCATCAYMLYSATAYAGKLSLVGAGLVAVGVPLFWLSGLLPQTPGDSET
jgi:amino acid transporter